MRRIVSVAFDVRDYVESRSVSFMGGDDIDILAELPRLRALISFLTREGLVKDSDWVLGSVSLSDRASAVVCARLSIEARILARIHDDKIRASPVERSIMVTLAADVASLVVEMTAAVLLHEVMLMTIESFVGRRERRPRRSRRRLDLALLAGPAAFQDPHTHLEHALGLRERAREEVQKARRRVEYVSRGKVDPEPAPKAGLPMPMLARMVSPSVEGLRSRFAGISPDLFGPAVEQPPRRIRRRPAAPE